MKPRLRRLSTWAVGAALLLAAAVLAWRHYTAPAGPPPGLVQANGRIEGDTVTVPSRYAGRIVAMLVEEGDRVREGDVLARLKDDTAKARVRQAEEKVRALEEQVRAARVKLDALERRVPLDVSRAGDAVARAGSDVAKAEAREAQAGRDAARYRNLLRDDTVARQRAEQAELDWTVARHELTASRKALEEARRNLDLARLGRRDIEAAGLELRGQEADLDQARAALDEHRAVLDDLTVTAPATGVVTAKLAQAGEAVTAGGPLYDIVDLQSLHLTAYVPETEAGMLSPGQPARIFVDAWPDRHFKARVSYVASKAEFTPKEVQTRDQRTKLVYEVKLALEENPGDRLTPGLPGDAVIRWKEDAPWRKPVW